MTDFHSHILPDVDDGSQNLDQSLTLLSQLSSFGFDNVVLTPHFYPQDEPLHSFLERRNNAFSLLCKHNTTNVKLYLGCECYLHEYLFFADDLSSLCINETNYLLTELSYERRDGQRMLDYIDRLTAKYNVKPILAHIERYPYIMNDPDMFFEFLLKGCFAQVNLPSLDQFFIKKKLLKYISKGYVNFIGTDTHKTVQPLIDCFDKVSKSLTAIIDDNWQKYFQSIDTFMNVKLI